MGWTYDWDEVPLAHNHVNGGFCISNPRTLELYNQTGS